MIILANKDSQKLIKAHRYHRVYLRLSELIEVLKASWISSMLTLTGLIGNCRQFFIFNRRSLLMRIMDTEFGQTVLFVWQPRDTFINI